MMLWRYVQRDRERERERESCALSHENGRVYSTLLKVVQKHNIHNVKMSRVHISVDISKSYE